MSHSNIQPIRDYFTNQIDYLVRNRKELTDAYLATLPFAGSNKNFLKTYIEEVKQYLQSPELNKAEFHKVFIGNLVSITFEDDEEPEDYRICLPEESDPDKGHISFLSPIGRNLLLKQIGEQVVLLLPGGEQKVSIHDITF